MKAQFLPLFNVNLSRLQLNSTSTQFQLNFHSISSQPHFNLRFKSISASISNSTSTITSTQYGCDIKATQSCNIQSLCNITLQNWTPAMLSLALLSPSLLWLFFHFDLYIFLNFGVVLDIFKLRQGASIPCFVGLSVGQSVCPKNVNVLFFNI